ncbi:hypothetical protein B0H16DRAFT_1591905 [Mycena metata]|uniref:F-box domain-containing protein n=1 Tax=Mycena metata TaxID=1033252 RepID=A0AAD7HRV4_9AGAR|nr:hypothetical protein B0H16DRAFT_1593680 [Mycena metata]KAJ7726962.1 hypothetical protein B0H16DRAFT_1591905 [Mycena metata]
MAEHFPNELWLMAIDYAPKSAVMNLSLTNRRLCHLSRPHLFAQFDFHPYACDGADGNIKIPTQRVVNRALKRLKFWASDVIAPLVRVCKISPFDPDGRKLSATDNPHVLLGPFFDIITSFTNLRALFVDKVHLTQTGVLNLCLLPKLHTLHIEEYRLAPGQVVHFDSSKLQSLTHLRIHNDSWTTETDHSAWISLLCAEKIRTLELTLNPPELLNIDLPSFPHAQTIAVGLKLFAAPQNIRILSKFPAVQVLSIQDAERPYGEWVGPGSRLPLDFKWPGLLCRYSGPFQTMNDILSIPTVTHLSLNKRSLHPPDFFQELQHGTPRNIASLSLPFKYFNNGLFDDLCGAFPALTRVQLTIANAESFTGLNWDEFHDWKAPFFLETLVTSLPARIEQLSIHWNMDFESVLDVLPPFRKLGDALLEKHRALNALWLGMYGFTVRARKSPDGQITAEEMLIREDEPHSVVLRIRREFNSSWDALDPHV